MDIVHTRLCLVEIQICFVKPSVLNGETIRQWDNIWLVWKSFIASESSEKIYWVLYKQIRLSEKKFMTGERVYFMKDNQWHGPSWVIGQDNVMVFIRYGDTYICVYQRRKLNELNHVIPGSENRTEIKDRYTSQCLIDQGNNGNEDKT